MYAKLRNKVSRLVRTAKSKYFCVMIEEAKGDSEKVWKAVNEACNRNSFLSYLTGRQQRTSCGNKLSEELLVTHGVPQGSIRGPLLFVIYINNLANVLNSCYASLYANGTVIYCYGTSSKELSDMLNNDLLGVAKWLHDHKLTLNLDKTKCMLIGSNRKRESKVDLTVSILAHSIRNVRSFKYLGIHISSDFTWTDHIEHLTGKVNQRLGLLKRIKHLLPFRARLLFYESLVMPLS